MEYEGWRIAIPGRRLVLALAGLIALLAVAAVAAHLYGVGRLEEAIRRAEEILGPTEPAAYAPPPVPPEANVAVRLAEVAEMLDAVPAGEGNAVLVRLPHRSPATWDAEDRQQVREFLLPRAAALARARGLADLTGSDFQLQRTAADPPTVAPDLLRGERLLHLHALFAAAEGQPALAVGSLAALGRLAEALYAESTPYTVSLGAKVETDQLVALHALLAAGVPDPEVLHDLERTLVRTDPFAALRRGTGFQVAREVLHLERPGGPPTDWNAPLPWRLAAAVVGEWLVAESLEPLLPLASAGRIPLPELERTLAEARSSTFGGTPFRRPASGALLARQAYSVAVGRLLARQTLDAAQAAALEGGYPPQPDPLPRDPAAFAPIRHHPTDDGGLGIAAPAAQDVLASAPGPRWVPLEWSLPPLPPLPPQPLPPQPRRTGSRSSAEPPDRGFRR